MSEQKIKLPDFLLAELYKNSVVELDTNTFKDTPPEQKPEPVPDSSIPVNNLTYLGENGKNVAIIVQQPGVKFIEEDDLAFLTNILKACKLTLADIAIINQAAQSVSFEQLKTELSARFVLLFEVEPSSIKLPFMIPVFQVQKYHDCSIMVAPGLSILNAPGNDARPLKTKLWNSLKQMFEI